ALRRRHRRLAQPARIEAREHIVQCRQAVAIECKLALPRHLCERRAREPRRVRELAQHELRLLDAVGLARRTLDLGASQPCLELGGKLAQLRAARLRAAIEVDASILVDETIQLGCEALFEVESHRQPASVRTVYARRAETFPAGHTRST